MASDDPKVITVRRSTAVRAGVVLLVLAALGIGTAIGLSVGSGNSQPSSSSSPGSSTSTTTRHGSTTTFSTATSTTVATPAVLSCGPGSTQHVQPATITVGCATKGTTVTNITWSTWDAEAGGQGTGTVTVGAQSAPAVVVVFHDLAGVFQDVSVTPSRDASSTPPTTTTTVRGVTPSFVLPTTTTTKAGGIAPVAAAQPGSGWGGS